MNSHLLLGAAMMLLVSGCGRDAEAERANRRLDFSNLEPFTNIPPGTIVQVQMRSTVEDYTRSDAVAPPVRYSLTNGSEYVLEGFSPGSVRLRRTNGTAISYAGRMIVSIQTKEEPKPRDK